LNDEATSVHLAIEMRRDKANVAGIAAESRINAANSHIIRGRLAAGQFSNGFRLAWLARSETAAMQCVFCPAYLVLTNSLSSTY